MSDYTPGPWSYEYQNDVGPNDDCFVEWYGMDGVFKADKEEDAKLICAAPALLEALIVMVAYYQSRSSFEEDKVQAMAYAAIELAMGKNI